jgi:hypothetical protein
MAGIMYFVALPFDFADGSVVVGDRQLSRCDCVAKVWRRTGRFECVVSATWVD